MSKLEFFIEDDLKKYLDVVDSTFYINIDGVNFPCEGWTDFIYPVLYDWTNEVLKYYNSDNVKFSLYFMDGSYYLLCEKTNNNVAIKCFHDKQIIQSTVIKYSDLITALKNAIGRFFRYSQKLEINDNICIQFTEILKQIKILEHH